jgi:hypothetical protein
MKDEQVLLLIGEIREGLTVFNKIHNLYLTYASVFDDLEKREIRDAILLTEILCNSYTCLETIFFRISRFFENNLASEKWHKELLHKMRIEVPNVRKAVLSSESYLSLDELRRFRHFKRYYFEFDYDWNRLTYLRSVYEKAFMLVPGELEAYTDFLTKLIQD